MKEKSNEVSTK